jgi:Flp pilus assembly protein TadD
MVKKFKNFTRCLAAAGLAAAVLNQGVPARADIKKSTAEQYRLKGFEAQEKGDVQAALENYIKAVAMGAGDAAVYNDMAIMYEDIGLKQKAEHFYLEALRRDKDFLPVYLNLAYLYLSQGDQEKAARYFKERYELSDSGDSWGQKAKEELLKIRPSYREWITRMEADKLQQEIVRREQDAFIARVNASQERYRQGLDLVAARRYESALVEFDRALELTPHNRKIVDAREDVLLRIVKENVREHSDRAIRLLEAGNSPAARGEFREILTTIPDESTIPR